MKRPLKPVNPRPGSGKDYAAEAELYCRTSSTRVLDEYILRLRKQLQIAEAIRAERKVLEAKLEAMTTAELEAVVAAGVPGPELAVAQMVLHARKPQPVKPKKDDAPEARPPPAAAPPRWSGRPSLAEGAELIRRKTRLRNCYLSWPITSRRNFPR